MQDELWYQKQQDAIRRMDAEEDLRDREEEEKRVLVAKVREEQVQQQRNMHASRARDDQERGRDHAQRSRRRAQGRGAPARGGEGGGAATPRGGARHAGVRLPTPSPSRRNPSTPDRPPARLPTPACPRLLAPPHPPRPPPLSSLPTPPNLRLSLPALFLGRDIHPPRAAARSLSLLRLRAPPRSLWRQTTRSWQKREEVRRLADIEEAAMLEYATGKEKDLLARRDREEERSARARRGGSRSLISRWRL